jgi:hypothetical protein
MDYDKDLASAIDKLGPLLHVDEDLRPFLARGGKLLFYIGWNDYHNPEQLIDYYEAVIKNSGGTRARDSLRLFTIPGMGHCMGGAGCDTFDKLGAIDRWVAQGKAPQQMEAAKVEAGNIVRTSLICAYPNVARYKGRGDINQSANFTCAGPQPPTAAESSLLLAEDQRFQAQIAHDIKAIGLQMADELSYTHASGRHRTKAEYLNDIESGRAPYRSIQAEDRSARVFGNVGTTRGQLRMVVGDKELLSSYLAVYVHRDGRWQLLDWQSSPDPAEVQASPPK